MREILALGPYRALYIEGESDELAISFASIGHDASRMPSPEFIATATGRGTGRARPALFIQDESRSWANHPDFEALVKGALARVSPPRKTVALGLSMGGFSALVAAQLITLDAVLAFVPQYSIDPEVMPQENRWAEWRQKIPLLRHRTCPLPPPPTQAYLFHSAKEDGDHAARFAQTKTCDHLLFADFGHSDLLPALKARGALAGLLQAAFAADRRRLLRIATSCGGIRRKA